MLIGVGAVLKSWLAMHMEMKYIHDSSSASDSSSTSNSLCIDTTLSVGGHIETTDTLASLLSGRVPHGTEWSRGCHEMLLGRNMMSRDFQFLKIEALTDLFNPTPCLITPPPWRPAMVPRCDHKVDGVAVDIRDRRRCGAQEREEEDEVDAAAV